MPKASVNKTMEMHKIVWKILVINAVLEKGYVTPEEKEGILTILHECRLSLDSMNETDIMSVGGCAWFSQVMTRLEYAQSYKVFYVLDHPLGRSMYKVGLGPSGFWTLLYIMLVAFGSALTTISNWLIQKTKTIEIRLPQYSKPTKTFEKTKLVA